MSRHIKKAPSFSDGTIGIRILLFFSADKLVWKNRGIDQIGRVNIQCVRNIKEYLQ